MKKNNDSAKAMRTVNRLPVSVRFYRRLSTRVNEIISTLHTAGSSLSAGDVMKLVDSYLQGDNIESPAELNHLDGYIIFLTLKAEIDTAIARSQRARQSAALRRSSVNTTSAIPSVTAGTPSAPAATPSVTAVTPSAPAANTPSCPAATPFPPHTPKSSAASSRPRNIHSLRWTKVTGSSRRNGRSRYIR